MMIIWQALFTLLLIVVSAVAAAVVSSAVARYGKRRGLAPARCKATVKLLNGLILFIALIVLLFIWGIDLKNFGIFLSSILGLVAIGFFAVWSILSNILAGLFLFMSDTFRLEDKITVLPDDISGTVKEIKLVFVVLEDDNGDVLHVPNNVLIQKVIKRKNRGS